MTTLSTLFEREVAHAPGDLWGLAGIRMGYGDGNCCGSGFEQGDGYGCFDSKDLHIPVWSVDDPL